MNTNIKLENIGFYTLSDDRAKNASESSQMKRCELILLEACNFKCPYCRGLDHSIYGDRKAKQLSFDEVKKVIDLWCQPVPLENIRFSGGEPTLHKNIVEIVQYAKSKGIKRIAISTNGSNKIELYQKLVDAGVNDFSISLDACCADDGDKLDLNRFKNGYLYFIDLNNFKRINDEHGHIYGDQVLTKFADEIRKCLGYSDVLIRYAGDEFVIVSEGKLKLESTMEFSQGFVRIKHSWEKKEDLLSEADKKMYRNKMKNKH